MKKLRLWEPRQWLKSPQSGRDGHEAEYSAERTGNPQQTVADTVTGGTLLGRVNRHLNERVSHFSRVYGLIIQRLADHSPEEGWGPGIDMASGNSHDGRSWALPCLKVYFEDRFPRVQTQLENTCFCKSSLTFVLHFRAVTSSWTEIMLKILSRNISVLLCGV